MTEYIGYQAILDGLTKAAEGVNLLRSGGGDFYLEQLADIYQAFFKTCPIQPGDVCVLKENVDCAGDWRGNEHWLKRGARGTVVSINWHKGTGFEAALIFESESYKDSKGILHPVHRKHTWTLPVAKLIRKS